MDDSGHRHGKHRKGGIKSKLIILGVVVVIVLIALFVYYFTGGPINVSGPTTLAINSQGTVFAIGGKSYVATLEGYNNNTQTAYVYVSQVPVFLGPILNITLHQNGTVKINYDTQYAIMQMMLLSATKSSASVQIAPLAASLQIDPDYQYIGHPTVSLPGLQITTTNAVNTTSTTTVAAASGNTPSTTSASTTIKATTTIVSTNYTNAAIKSAVEADENYALMLNFTTLYDQTLNCTSQSYGVAYFKVNAAFPVPPADYKNVSYETPYGMVQKIVSKGGNSYAYEFLPLVKDPAFNGTVALKILVSVASAGTSSAVGTVSANNYTGIFTGLAYSDLSAQYGQTKAVGGSCSALVG